MDNSSAASKIRRHINFAVRDEEIRVCGVCGNPPPAGRLGGWYARPSVTPAGAHVVSGIIGLCMPCLGYAASRRQLLNKWRATAPQFVHVIPGKPIQLVVRGICDDMALVQLIRDVIGKVPDRSWNKMLDYVLSHNAYCVTQKGLRFEALGSWPGMKNCAGMNMDGGHVIRLRASGVRQYLGKASSNSSTAHLANIIAHELAHTEQYADGKRFPDRDECERDVEARLHAWGFHQESDRSKRKQIAAAFDWIIDKATTAKKQALRVLVPSGNYAHHALSHAEKAANHVDMALFKWSGID